MLYPSQEQPPPSETKVEAEAVEVKEPAAPVLLEPPAPAHLEVAGRFKKIKAKTGEGTRAYRSLRSNTCENLSAIPQVGSLGGGHLAKCGFITK